MADLSRQQEAYEDGKASQIRGAKRLLPAKITYNPDRTDWISIADAWYRGFDEALLAEPVTTGAMTAHDLAATWEWEEEADSFKLKGGRVEWEQASYGRSMRRVRIARLEVTDRGIRQINRYIDPDTEVELVVG